MFLKSPLKFASLSRKNAQSSLKQGGFTLLEILIVLGILGTITAMVMSRIMDSRNRAKVKEANLQLNQWSEAVNMFYNDCGKYPDGLEALSKGSADCKNWEPGAYAKLKTRDPWGTEFQYSVEGNGFSLKSLGQDKKEGGTGNDADIEAGSDTGSN
jgi:general secretion pathway protein G